MAVMKKKTRKKLSKQLDKLIKLHGAEMSLALVTGIVSALAAERKSRADRKRNRRAPRLARPRSRETGESRDTAKAEKSAKAPVKAGRRPQARVISPRRAPGDG